jgi:hypothetical protein
MHMSRPSHPNQKLSSLNHLTICSSPRLLRSLLCHPPHFCWSRVIAFVPPPELHRQRHFPLVSDIAHFHLFRRHLI